MTEITLTYIYSSPQDESVLSELVAEFGARHNLRVNLKRMTWGTAWTELFTIASTGEGAEVSHLGGTWVGSLAKMNALRAFKPAEVAEINAGSPFMVPTWESTRLFEDERIWSVPWTGWVYVICYRKDLLQQAGIEPSAAFGTIPTLSKTIEALRNSSLEIPWLNPCIPEPYTDLLHMAASWIWAAGGDFIDASGTKVVFDSPASLQGLTGWLDTFRAVAEPFRDISVTDATDHFAQGRAAALLTDIHVANRISLDDKFPQVRDNLGVANLTDVPWTGGGNFVIWDHTRVHYEREQAAIELIKFMTSREANLRWKQGAGHMPARIDALEDAYPAGGPLHEVVMHAARHGRAYHNVSLWRRMEFQIARELDAIIRDAHKNPSTASAEIVKAHLAPLARQINIMLAV